MRNESIKCILFFLCLVNSQNTFSGTWEDWAYKTEENNVVITRYLGKKSKVDVPEKIYDGNVTKIGNSTFKKNELLTDVHIPNTILEVEKGAFFGCISLQEINIPKSVKRIGDYAFTGCISVKEIKIPDSVIEIGESAFESCKELRKIEFGKNVLKIKDRALANCPNLQKITIPRNVFEIGNETFSCHGLSALRNFKQHIEKVSYSPYARLEEINVDEENPHYLSQEGVLFNKNKTILLSYPAAKNKNAYSIPQEVLKIQPYAFEANQYLTNIVIPDSVIEIGKGAFASSSKLKSLDLPKDIKKIESRSFESCVELENLEIPSGVSYIGSNAFSNCESLKQIILPAEITCIEESTFMNCKNLKKMQLPQKLKIIGPRAFAGCVGLSEIKIPATVERIQSEAFKGCLALKDVEFEDISSIYYVESDSFSGCELSLKSSQALMSIENGMVKRGLK